MCHSIRARQLVINRDRYRNIKQKISFVNFVQQKKLVEDIMHFLSKRKKFSCEHDELFKYIEKSCKIFEDLSEENIFDTRGYSLFIICIFTCSF